MQPRPYQRAALDGIHDAYRRGRRSVLITMATGTGKTVVFATLIHERHQQGDRRPTLVIAHREELLSQAAEKISEVCPRLRVDIEQAGRKASTGSSVVIASVQTISRANSERLAWLRPGLIVVDEAHHAAANGYQAVLKRFAGPETQVLGVTATPHRLDGKELHGKAAIFEEVAFNYPIRQAIEDGFLCDLRGYRVETETDLGGIETTRLGDFAQGDLARRVDNPARTRAALKHWLEVARDRRTIAFCAGVEHAHHVAEEFRARSITAEALDGSMHSRDRAAIMERVRSGRTQVLANCEIATEGFDVPPISCVMMLRPTQSWGLYVQCIGRGTRLSPETGKRDLVVIDCVDNCTRHNLATVPAILGLPPGLDLEGKSLVKAAQSIEEMGARAAVLQHALPGSWTELQTMLLQVDLFGAIETPQELAGARLRWLSVPGGYHVSCGAGKRAKLTEDVLGQWEVTLSQAEENHWERLVTYHCGEELTEAVRLADDRVLLHWPSAGAVAGREARWLKDRPSEKQIEWLRKFKQPDNIIAALDKGQASGLLTQLFARSR